MASFHLGSGTRTALRFLGAAVITLLTFLFAVQLTFPYDRVKTRIAQSMADKYDVTIGDIHRSWIPGKFTLESITLRSKPLKADDPVTTVFVKSATINLHFLPLLSNRGAADLDIVIGNGHIKGSIAGGKAGTSIHLEGSDLPGEQLPVREYAGLPIGGDVDFDIALELPNDVNKAGRRAPDWSQAEGVISLSCPRGCNVGDGKTPLKLKAKNARSQAFVGEGVPFGPINLSSMLLEIDVTPRTDEGKPGKLEVKKFDAKSEDGTLKIDFVMATMPEIGESPVNGCLSFKGSPELEKRVPKTFAELQTTGALLGPDGLFHIKLTDKFRDIRRLPQPCGPDIAGSNDMAPSGLGGPSGTRRPNLAPATATDVSRQPSADVNAPAPPPVAPPAVMQPPTAAPEVQGSAQAGSGAGAGSAGSAEAGSGNPGPGGSANQGSDINGNGGPQPGVFAPPTPPEQPAGQQPPPVP